VAGGTSGHLVGAALAAILLGPGAAILVMSCVLILQCLMFADGGLTALGANIFNMAIIAPLTAYGIYRLIVRFFGESLRSKMIGVAFSAWCSTVIAAISCAGQLAMSGTVRWSLVFPAMAGIHMIIGAGEALITTLVIAAVVRSRPDIMDDAAHAGGKPGFRELVIYGLFVSAGLAVFVAPFASPWPDGLEKVAGFLGFESLAYGNPAFPGPLADYKVPGLKLDGFSTALAGLAGTVAAFILSIVLARSLTPAGNGKPDC